MSNVIMALTVMVTLLFLMPLFVYTPNVVLGAIIVAAVIGLIDIPAIYHIWKMDKMDFLVCVCAFAGVLFISVQEGLAIAVTNIKFSPFGSTKLFFIVAVLIAQYLIYFQICRLAYLSLGYCCKSQGQRSWFKETLLELTFTETSISTRMLKEFLGS
jgi:hypothetical protein